MKSKFIPILFGLGVVVSTINLSMDLPGTRELAMLAFGLLFLLSIRKTLSVRNGNPFFNKWIYCVAYSYIIAFIYQTNAPMNVMNEPLVMAMPLIICVSSACTLDMSIEDFKKWFTFFCPLAIIGAIYIILFNGGGFVILDMYNDAVEKNQICPFFSIISILSLTYAIERSSGSYLKVLYYVTFVACLLPNVYLSARASLISTLVACMVVVYSRYKSKGIVVAVLFVMILFYIKGNQIVNLLNQSVIGRRDLTDFDDLTSGRVSLTERAWEDFLHYFWFGGFADDQFSYSFLSQYSNRPHMFILWKWLQFGLIGGLGYLISYLSIFKMMSLAYKLKEHACLGGLFVALFLSFAEYGSPFGPGMTYVLLYIMVGQMIRKHYLIS